MSQQRETAPAKAAKRGAALVFGGLCLVLLGFAQAQAQPHQQLNDTALTAQVRLEERLAAVEHHLDALTSRERPQQPAGQRQQSEHRLNSERERDDWADRFWQQLARDGN